MAGGGNHPKSSSSNHRKSRWQPSSSSSAVVASAASTTNTKSSAPKPPTKPNPSPKPNNNPTPSPAHHSKPKLSPARAQAQFPPPPPPSSGPPPPPAYGFHMLERRTILLADGSVRSYFALPPDYHDFTPPRPPLPPMDPTASRFLPPTGLGPERFPINPEGFRDNRDYWGGTPIGEKRKLGTNEEAKRGPRPNGYPFWPETNSPFRGEIGGGGQGGELRASKYMRVGGESETVLRNKHLEVDQSALKKAFLHYVKVINENATQRKNYLESGKQGRLQCVACGSGRK